MIKRHYGLVLVTLLSVIPLLPLLQPGLPLTHDGQDHVARIANFYQSLIDGNIVPRWAGNLNWGYGHPILMFLYPLPSYTASVFHILGFSFVDSTKLVFAAAYAASGITMYLWIRKLLGEQAALVGSIVYNFAPYRFVDLYVRGAIGEHVAFIFPPLILYFLLKISENKKFEALYFVAASASLAGLLLSHNALSLMFFPFIAFYAVYLILISTSRKLLAVNYLLLAVLGFGLSAFFLLPAFIEGKYTLRDIVTEGVALGRFVQIKNIISSPWNFGQTGQFSVEVGWPILLSLLLSPLVFYRLIKSGVKNLVVYCGALVYFAGSIFIMLPESKSLWEAITLLQKFQFPWRFLSPAVFAGALMCAFTISIVSKKNIRVLLTAVTIVAVLVSTREFWRPQSQLSHDERFYTGVYNGTTDTGESSPIWSVRFMEREASSAAEVLSGSASIKETERESARHRYEVLAKSTTRIRENTLYFPGWAVFADGKEIKEVEFQDQLNRGLITYVLPKGNHNVEIIFKDTKLRIIANLITLVSLLIVVILTITSILNIKHKKSKK